MSGLVPGVERIAVLRANGIGDLVFALPALDALRHAYPAARIDLLAAPWAADLLHDRPSPVDRVVPLPPIPGVSAPPDAVVDDELVRRTLASLRGERYDLAVQLHGGGRYSNPLTSALGARLTAGLRAPDAPALDRWVRYEYWHPEVLRFLEVVSLVGASPVRLEPHLSVTDADRCEAEPFVGAAGGRRIAVLNPGAGDARRRWPPERFAAVADLLAKRGLAVVIVGDEDDATIAKEIVRLSDHDLVVAAGHLSLGGLCGLFSRAAVVVSNDSGPLHLARAVGAPTVGIYWCGNVINAGPLTSRHHRSSLAWQLTCPVCGVRCSDETAPRCEHDDSFVGDVTVEQVAGHAIDLLDDGDGDGDGDGEVEVDVLVPTCDRPAALAVTLTSLVGQVGVRFRVVVSDQSRDDDPFEAAEVRAAVNVLRETGHDVVLLRHVPRRGMAEHRQFLLDQARAPYALFLDDDVILESDLLARLLAAIRSERCGFVGSFVNAPGSVRSDDPVDEPPAHVDIELWEGRVEPEAVRPGSPGWERRHLHFAAYLQRIAARRGIRKEDRHLYKVAWVGGCVLFDVAVLRAAGGFGFWSELPEEHAGEDVVAQLRVMALAGGAGIVPSGAWHQEVRTTIPHDRRGADAPYIVRG